MRIVVVYFPSADVDPGHIEAIVYSDESSRASVCACGGIEDFPTRADYFAYDVERQVAENILAEAQEGGAKVVELTTTKTYADFLKWSAERKQSYSYTLMGDNCADIVSRILKFCGFEVRVSGAEYYFRSCVATLCCVLSLRGLICFPVFGRNILRCFSCAFPIKLVFPRDVYAQALVAKAEAEAKVEVELEGDAFNLLSY